MVIVFAGTESDPASSAKSSQPETEMAEKQVGINRIITFAGTEASYLMAC